MVLAANRHLVPTLYQELGRIPLGTQSKNQCHENLVAVSGNSGTHASSGVSSFIICGHYGDQSPNCRQTFKAVLAERCGCACARACLLSARQDFLLAFYSSVPCFLFVSVIVCGASRLPRKPKLLWLKHRRAVCLSL